MSLQECWKGHRKEEIHSHATARSRIEARGEVTAWHWFHLQNKARNRSISIPPHEQIFHIVEDLYILTLEWLERSAL